MSQSALPVLILCSKADKRLRNGHQWIYSNEVDKGRTPLTDFETGVLASVQNAQGKTLGVATINPHTLICARMMSRKANCRLNRAFFVDRINRALKLREEYFSLPFYRLVYGDSDGLSGLVIDRFGDTLVVQISTAGMERVKEDIIKAICQVLKPRAVLLKNDSAMRESEGLPSYIEEAWGDVMDLVQIEENDTQFLVPVKQGQKTGWFYDHRVSRALLQKTVRGKRVLDLFSYVGAWGIEALVAGAKSSVCVDSSSQALEWAQQNAGLNGVADQLTTLKDNAFDAAQNLLSDGERFDVVVVDPPAFIKRRKDLHQGERAYRRVNELALRLLEKDGLLVSASCSMHMSRAMLVDALRGAARHVDRGVQIISQGYQGPDHPIHPAMSETEYLKALFARNTGGLTP